MLCVNEHEHRDRALADAVAPGASRFAGETRELGLEPDWLHADLPEDEEWRIDWVKFYYGLDLADAFRATGERRYLEAWEKLVASFVAAGPARPRSAATSPPAGSSTGSTPGSGCRRSVTASRAALVESLREQARHVRDNLTPERNHRTLELYALLVAALALPDLEPGLETLAVEELHANLLTDFGPDGVHRERSTHYHMIALRSFVGARENCRRFGVELPAGFDERLARACDFALHCRGPTARSPRSRTATPATTPSCCALAARLLARDDLLRTPQGGQRASRTAATSSSAPATAT